MKNLNRMLSPVNAGVAARSNRFSSMIAAGLVLLLLLYLLFNTICSAVFLNPPSTFVRRTARHVPPGGVGLPKISGPSVFPAVSSQRSNPSVAILNFSHAPNQSSAGIVRAEFPQTLASLEAGASNFGRRMVEYQAAVRALQNSSDFSPARHKELDDLQLSTILAGRELLRLALAAKSPALAYLDLLEKDYRLNLAELMTALSNAVPASQGRTDQVGKGRVFFPLTGLGLAGANLKAHKAHLEAIARVAAARGGAFGPLRVELSRAFAPLIEIDDVVDQLIAAHDQEIQFFLQDDQLAKQLVELQSLAAHVESFGRVFTTLLDRGSPHIASGALAQQNLGEPPGPHSISVVHGKTAGEESNPRPLE
ncbi:MAG: hypothetical protein WCS94_14040 [Verrucomicrobiota bacterium]